MLLLEIINNLHKGTFIKMKSDAPNLSDIDPAKGEDELNLKHE